MRRKKPGWAAALLLLAGVSTPAQETKTAQVAGVWDMTVETPNGTGNPVLSLKQDGEAVSGEYQGRLGVGAVKGTVKGNEIQLSVALDVEGNSFTILYSGKVDGANMSGQADFGEYGGGKWSAKKRP